MRRRLSTSSVPSNWTPAASVLGPSWAMNTWKWRTRPLPSKLTGQTENEEERAFIVTAVSVSYLMSYLFVMFIHQACHWSEQAWLPGLVWPGSNIRDPQDAFLLSVLLSKGSPAQVGRASGVSCSRSLKQKLLDFMCSDYFIVMNCRDMLWYIFVGLMTHACWSHWVKAMKNCRSKWKPKRYETAIAERRFTPRILWGVRLFHNDIICFCPVLLEGILCWRCWENGSAQTGKVSVCPSGYITPPRPSRVALFSGLM